MRSLVIDELPAADVEKLLSRLGETLISSGLPDVFWMEMPHDLLTGLQMEHKDSCGPHRVAVVVEEDSLRLELLIRAQESLRCDCTEYPTKAQREFLLGYFDRLIDELELST